MAMVGALTRIGGHDVKVIGAKLGGGGGLPQAVNRSAPQNIRIAGIRITILPNSARELIQGEGIFGGTELAFRHDPSIYHEVGEFFATKS